MGNDGSDDRRRHRAVPAGRLSRLARLAGVGLRSGAGMLLGDGELSAAHAAEALGQLRGLAAKVGQMAGYIDGIVPTGQRDTYQKALSALQAAATHSDPALIRRFVEDELGAPIDRLFVEWDDPPVASASIGQVHRARLPEALGGGEVAVKVQHPGIARALEGDLRNAGVLEAMLGALGGRKLNSAEVLEAVRTRLREELDYHLEARHMELFRGAWVGDPLVAIPAPIGERSTRRVLTTEFVRGRGFAAACAASPGERAAWATTLWRFIFRSNLVLGHFNADPHPGNYFFHEGGGVTFLDFGCVNPLGEGQLRLAHHIHHAALRGDERAFREATRHHMQTRPGRLERPILDYLRRCFAPLFEAPFRMTRDYAASLLDGMTAMGRLALHTPDDELFTQPPDMIFMNRLQFGFYSVLARLDVEVDYASVERAFWPQVVEAHGVAPLH